MEEKRKTTPSGLLGFGRGDRSLTCVGKDSRASANSCPCNSVPQGERGRCVKRSGMQAIAVDMIFSRRNPSHPEYMDSECSILQFLASRYPSTVHGYSTSLMAAMFRVEHLLANLPPREFFNLVSYIYTGRPRKRSAYDGMHHARIQPAPQQKQEESSLSVSSIELNAYIQQTLGLTQEELASFDDPAFSNARDAPLTGFDMLDEADFDEFDQPPRSQIEHALQPPPIAPISVPLDTCADGSENDDDGDDDTQGDAASSAAESSDSVMLVTPLDKCASIRGRVSPISPLQKNRERKNWTKKEDDCIMEYHSQHGARWRDMARVLARSEQSSRSDDALRNRFSRLVARKHDRDPSPSDPAVPSKPSKRRRSVPRVQWTDIEDELILSSVLSWNGQNKWQSLAERLPGRTPHAVRNRANRLLMGCERASLIETQTRDTPLSPCTFAVGVRLNGCVPIVALSPEPEESAN